MIKDLTWRKLPSSFHEKAWANYDKILLYRANIAQMTNLLYFVLFYSMGLEHIQLSKEYLEEGNLVNPEL